MNLYLDLLKRCLTRTLFPDQRYGPDITKPLPFDPDLRRVGRDWPTEAVTMVGMERLNTLQNAVESVVAEGIAGDLVECGVWRGGASILMRATLEACGDTARSVWLYDSFQGLPRPSDPADLDLTDLTPYLGVSLEQVKKNFELFKLLDNRVNFVQGWFNDTLPVAQVQQIAVLRLDGDMYESTMVALDSLYPKVSAGGYIIIDDYGALPHCQRAVNDFRAKHGIASHIFLVDWTGAYWRK
jgi:hypothetical protein